MNKIIKFRGVQITFQTCPLNKLSISLETQHLIICSVKLEYASDYYILFSDPEVMKNYEYGIPFMDHSIIKNRILDWVQKWQSFIPYSGYSVFDKAKKCFVGHIDLEVTNETANGMIELGYIYMKQYWGRGIGTEAASAIIHYLVPSLIQHKFKVNKHHLKKVIATTKIDNAASQQILQKVGFSKDNIIINRYGAERYRFYMPTKQLIGRILSNFE
jgi:[ribosomal protein S5]-alanine N-acetyltransferase